MTNSYSHILHRLSETDQFVVKAALSYALSNCMDMNSALSVCPYCGGDCLLYPDDGESGCDGYLGDIDGLLSDRKPDDRLEVQGNYGNSISEEEIKRILEKI